MYTYHGGNNNNNLGINEIYETDEYVSPGKKIKNSTLTTHHTAGGMD